MLQYYPCLLLSYIKYLIKIPDFNKWVNSFFILLKNPKLT